MYPHVQRYRTGVSLIELDPHAFDTGRVLMQRQVEMPRDPGYWELLGSLGQMGARMLGEVLADGRPGLRRWQQQARSQSELVDKSIMVDGKEWHAPKLKRSDGRIANGSGWSALDIYRRWRAFGHQYPIHFCYHGKPPNTTSEIQLVDLKSPWLAQKEIRLLRQHGRWPDTADSARAGTVALNEITDTLFIRSHFDLNKKAGIQAEDQARMHLNDDGLAWLAVKRVQIAGGRSEMSPRAFMEKESLKSWKSCLFAD